MNEWVKKTMISWSIDDDSFYTQKKSYISLELFNRNVCFFLVITYTITIKDISSRYGQYEIFSMEKQYDGEMEKKSGKQWKTTPKIINKKFFIRTYIWYLILAIRIHRKKNEIESLSEKRLRNLIPKNFSERMKNWWCYLPIPHTHT